MRPLATSIAIRVLLQSLIVLAVFECGVAQNEDNSGGAVNSLVGGNTALSFQLAENFDLEPFSGATISLKRMQSNSGAYRFGFSVNARTVDTPDDYDIITTEIVLQRLNHLIADRPVSPFYAFGPMVGYSSAKDSTEWRLGIVLTLGAEWFATKNLSITGEYGTSAAYYVEDIKVVSYNFDDEHGFEIPRHRTEGFVLIPNAVKLGVSFYW